MLHSLEHNEFNMRLSRIRKYFCTMRGAKNIRYSFTVSHESVSLQNGIGKNIVSVAFEFY